MPGKKLYVGNLSFGVTGQMLTELFSQHGKVGDAVVIKDKFTNKSRGFGFVEFESSEDAQNAMNALNGTGYEGRNLTINEARERTDSNRGKKNFRKRY